MYILNIHMYTHKYLCMYYYIVCVYIHKCMYKIHAHVVACSFIKNFGLFTKDFLTKYLNKLQDSSCPPKHSTQVWVA